LVIESKVGRCGVEIVGCLGDLRVSQAADLRARRDRPIG
jgi:hypothetical protein